MSVLRPLLKLGLVGLTIVLVACSAPSMSAPVSPTATLASLPTPTTNQGSATTKTATFALG